MPIIFECPIHNQTLVLREGVSKKTGKEYSFYGCSVKENGQFCAHTIPNAQKAPLTQVFTVSGNTSPSENTALLQSILKELVKIRESVISNNPPIINKTSTNDEPLPF